MTKVSTSTLERVVTVLGSAGADGMTVERVAAAIDLGIITTRKALQIVGQLQTPHRELQRGAQARYTLSVSAPRRVAEYLTPPSAGRPSGPIEGVCVDCTCKLQASDFQMVAGRPVLPRCPKAPVLGVSFAERSATAPVSRFEVPIAREALAERAVLRALQRSLSALAVHELLEHTSLRLDELTATLQALRSAGAIVTLLKVRPNRPALAVYAMPDTVPEPLRAS